MIVPKLLPLTRDWYYIIFNSRFEIISKRVGKRIKKVIDSSTRTAGGKPVYTSDNHPIKGTKKETQNTFWYHP